MLDCMIGGFGNTSDKEPPTNNSDHMDSALFTTGSLYLSEYTALLCGGGIMDHKQSRSTRVDCRLGLKELSNWQVCHCE